jgi:LPXTG-site transpeptidase (sortase) family protein
MYRIASFVAGLICAVKRIYARKASFLGVFAFVFIGSVIALGRLDLLPSPVKVTASESSIVSKNVTKKTFVSVQNIAPELPTKIEIPAIKLSAAIANPTTTTVEILDQDLLKGAVRYPTSARLGEIGNVVLFGHSSYLPIVGNQAYKTFNGIQKLSAGDTVIVYSSGAAYTYTVRSVAKESANNAVIQLSVTDKVLTLSTCNSFAEKTDRFVVVADFVESHSISG